MSKIEVNQISSQCGATLTIGQSGDTVTLAAGATQSGFGQTYSASEYCTTVKTAPFTAVAGKGYFINTTCAAVTVTLPATPTVGDIVSVKDYAGTWNTNALTIARNGSKLDGTCTCSTRSNKNEALTLIYVDSTQGWKPIVSGDATIGLAYITATGGSVVTCGDYKIHTFTADGCFSVSAGAGPVAIVDYMVVAGGGGGGGQPGGGGGGAGGYRESYCATTSGTYTASPLASGTSIPVGIGNYPIVIGGGGAGACSTLAGTSGSDSSFSTITSTGGGGGSGDAPTRTAKTGGSGGGGGFRSPGPFTIGAAGNTPPVSPSQGNPGGDATTSTSNPDRAGGGGGAGAVGGSVGTGPSGAPGGNGVSTEISGSSTTYAGGGGGGKDEDIPNGGTSGDGGTGGGGRGASSDGSNPRAGANGTANTGGGGGGAGGAPYASGYTGGSGIVIIRYKYQ